MSRRKLLVIVPVVGLAALLGGLSLIGDTDTVLLGVIVTALGNGLIVFTFVAFISRIKYFYAETGDCENQNTLLDLPRSFANRPFYNYSSRRLRYHGSSRRIELSPSLTMEPDRTRFHRSRSQYSRRVGSRAFTSGRRSQTFSVQGSDLMTAIENGSVRLASSCTMRSLQDKPPSYDAVCTDNSANKLTLGGESKNPSNDGCPNLKPPIVGGHLGNRYSFSRTGAFDSTKEKKCDTADQSVLCIPSRNTQHIVDENVDTKSQCQNLGQKTCTSHSLNDGCEACEHPTQPTTSPCGNIPDIRNSASGNSENETVALSKNSSDLPSYESVKHIRPPSEDN